jgi:hypothetical protein
VFEQQGVSSDGPALGIFRAEGIRPRFAEKLKAAGFDLPSNMFDQPERERHRQGCFDGVAGSLSQTSSFESATSLTMTTQVPCTFVTLAAGAQFAKIAQWI